MVAGGHAERALKEVEALVAANPQNPQLLAQHAMLLSLNRRDMQALRLLDALAARQPDAAAPWHLTALIYLHSGDLELARTSAQKALRIEPRSAPVLRTMGEIQARQARLSWDLAARADGEDLALRRKLAALGDLLAPPGSPFAQPGALAALAPPGLVAPTAVAPAALPVLAAAGVAVPGSASSSVSSSVNPSAGSSTTPPVSPVLAGPTFTTAASSASVFTAAAAGSSNPARRVVVTAPASATLRDVAASTRDPGALGAVTFVGVAAGMHVTPGFVELPQVAIDPRAAAASSPAASAPGARESAPNLALDAGARLRAAPARAGAVAVPPAPPSSTALPAAPAAPAVAEARADVDAALRRWAQAWSRRDVPAYLAAYSSDFTGQARDRATWERERRERITARSSIQVELSDIDIRVTGDRAQVRLLQRYVAGVVRSENRKRFELQREAGGWRIRREAAEG